jgi:hypothetical protein
METIYIVVGGVVLVCVMLAILLGIIYGTPNDINCEVSDWSACSKSCGTGTQTRTIITPSSGNGTACPLLVQDCNTQACPTPAPKIQPFAPIEKTTLANDWGNSNTFFLDRHDINCGDKSVLNQLVLTRPAENQLQYKYTCLSASDIGPSMSKETPLNDGSASSIYLDRHDVKCDAGSGLSELKLETVNGNSYHYKYQCATVPSMGSCVEKTTPANDWGNGSVIFLDRHNVKCEPNQVLSRLKLTRPEPDKLQYNYTCCSR